MSKLRKIVKTLSAIPSVYRAFNKRYTLHKPRAKSTEEIFTDIYTNNAWHGKDSSSGTGSDLHQTRVIAEELPGLITDLGVSTMLDIPCGDFHWMKRVDLSHIEYIGADIVNELIRINNNQFGKDCVCFQKLNLIEDRLPQVDMIFCRDCLVHFSYTDIFRALKNMCKNHAEYILTTTFTEKRQNFDIETGRWRPLNLELAPFMLPPPLKIIEEGCTEDEGAYTDKALGLWRSADIQKSLTSGSA